LVRGRTECSITSGHKNHGINKAALSLELSAVVCNQGFVNGFVCDSQAAVHWYLCKCHHAAVAAGDEKDAEEELGVTPRSHVW
ncbi:hypothetical protein, partial [Escherichia coli]|uniref:hypothetical protein n=1 Tax=Escherichia coli TaxID=562 RepID=UPI001BDC8934